SGVRSFSRRRIPAGRCRAISFSRSRKSPRTRSRLVTQISLTSLHIEVIVQDRLQPLAGNVLIHLSQAAVVVDLKLLVPLVALSFLSAVLALMIADAGGNPRGNFCR